MSYQRLFILIEGNDDERFFMGKIKPRLEEKYDSVHLWKYAQEKDKKVDNFLRSIKAMGADYIYVTDINLGPCVTAKKQEKQDKYGNIDSDQIIVVIKEIESWYLAGLDEDSSRRLGIPSYTNTDDLTKQRFNSLIPKQFGSRVDFMQESLKYFQIEIAKQKNKSFKYFLEKHDCNVC